MNYIHYGSSTFEPLRWNPIRNAPIELSFEKPTGGLWASPVGAKLGWETWCRSQEFCLNELSECFEFELSSDARVLKITSEEVVQSLPRILNDPTVNELMQRYSRLSVRAPKYPIDYELLAKDYDVIEFLASGFSLPNKVLSGWDCDCILVMNKDVIVEQTR